jgi:predicted DCC family thiol-disulfide oxidoreductase YuxK
MEASVALMSSQAWTPADGRHLVLWDGDCDFCRAWVSWARRHDRAQRLHFLPYQEAPSPPMTAALYAACGRAVHVITTRGTTLRAGAAIVFVLEQVGYRNAAAVLRLPPLNWCTELGYAVVARNRNFFARLLLRRRCG